MKLDTLTQGWPTGGDQPSACVPQVNWFGEYFLEMGKETSIEYFLVDSRRETECQGLKLGLW